jgi:hypothetical protein
MITRRYAFSMKLDRESWRTPGAVTSIIAEFRRSPNMRVLTLVNCCNSPLLMRKKDQPVIETAGFDDDLLAGHSSLRNRFPGRWANEWGRRGGPILTLGAIRNSASFC